MAKCDIFISYNWDIKEQVKLLQNKLKSLGYSVWRDEEELSFADGLHSQLAEAIKNSKLVLVCLTQKYIASENCTKELQYANLLKKPLSVLMIDHMKYEEMGGIGFIIGPLLRVNCYKNKSDWPDANLDEIVKSIKDNTRPVKDSNHKSVEDNSTSELFLANFLLKFSFKNLILEI